MCIELAVRFIDEFLSLAGAAAGGARATGGPSPGGGDAPAAEALQVSEETAAVLPLLNVAGTSSRAEAVCRFTRLFAVLVTLHKTL